MNERIEYGYDRHYRSWVIIVFDENGNEIENSYVGNKADRDYEIEYFKEKYNVDKSRVKKIKAY